MRQNYHKSTNNARSSHHKAVEDLESEMKLLQWHKLANESALQSALMRTRTIREEEAGKEMARIKLRRTKKKERLKKVLEEEEAKPLAELEHSTKLRFRREEAKIAAAERTRRECRENLLIESKTMIEERVKLKSRQDYSKHIRSVNNNGTGEIRTCNPSEAEKFNDAESNLKAIRKTFDDVVKSIQQTGS